MKIQIRFSFTTLQINLLQLTAIWNPGLRYLDQMSLGMEMTAKPDTTGNLLLLKWFQLILGAGKI